VKVEEALSDLLTHIGAFGGFSRLGQFTAGLVSAPSGNPAVTFSEESIIELERVPRPSTLEPVIWRALVGYSKNYTPQDDLASGVTAARRSYAAEEYRFEKSDDTNIASRHRLAQEYIVPALFRDQADALAEAARLMELWSVDRSFFRMVVPVTAVSRDLGEVVTVIHSRHGLSSGVSARILGQSIKRSNVELLVLV
jgi:hypothetical protein